MKENPQYRLKSIPKLKVLAFLVFSLIFCQHLSSQSVTWQRFYDIPGNNRSVSKATCLADSSNFYSGGTAFIEGDWRIYVMKLNASGDTIWTKRIDTLGTEVFAMAPSGDGGCVITGDNNYTIKLSPAGNIVWVKYYGGSGIQLYDIIKTSDGGYIACGDLFDINNFTNSGVILKIDINGNLIWQKTYFSNYSTIYLSILEINSLEYVVTGGNIDFASDTGKVIIVKINNTGDTIWQKKYSAFNKFISGHYINKYVNQYIISGNTTDITGNFSNTFMMRIDTSGNYLYAKKFEANRNEGFYDMEVINHNKYVFTRSRGLGDTTDSYVSVIDSLGNLIYGKSIILPVFVIMRSIIKMSNGDFIFAGNGRTSLQSLYKTYIVRTDSLLNYPPIGISNNQSNIPFTFELFQNYPNPFNSTTIISFNLKKYANVELKIYDITGKVLSKILNGYLSPGKHSVTYHSNNNSSGIYFYQLYIDKEKTLTKKMIIIK